MTRDLLAYQRSASGEGPPTAPQRSSSHLELCGHRQAEKKGDRRQLRPHQQCHDSGQWAVDRPDLRRHVEEGAQQGRQAPPGHHRHHGPHRQERPTGLLPARAVAQHRGDRRHQQDHPDGSGQRDRRVVVQAVDGLNGLGEGVRRHQHDEAGHGRQTCDPCQQCRTPVLVQHRPVPLHAVEPVGPTLQLTHRRRQRNQRKGHTQHEREDVVLEVLGPGRQHPTEQVLRCAWGELEHGLEQDLSQRLVPQGAAEADGRDDERDRSEAELEPQGARVREAVPVTEADQREADEPPGTVPPQRAPGVQGRHPVLAHVRDQSY